MNAAGLAINRCFFNHRSLRHAPIKWNGLVNADKPFFLPEHARQGVVGIGTFQVSYKKIEKIILQFIIVITFIRNIYNLSK